ncbi:hypothetical protein FRC00_001676 [Tulasnella sp. 408]|nr:hypothetical protein FRC00_001676 [Tulasnella sp. 408]
MSSAQVQPPANIDSPWKVPQVNGGLQFTTKLLEGVLDLGVKSPNHSLKAQHLLSRGIEVLVSIQHFLQSGENSLLETLETLNELEATENVLTKSIAILDEDTKEADSHPCDRAVMSSWHLNRNAFTANLKELAHTGPQKDDDRWTIVMRDVVRADDLSFATRLSNDVEKNCKDEVAKKAVKDIVASLEATQSATKDEEVEKPLLLHHGEYTIPDIIEDAQAEILSIGAILGGTKSSPSKQDKAEKHVKQIVGVMNEATRNLRSLVLKEKSFDNVRGKKNENQILYATMRLLGVRTTKKTTEVRENCY